MECFNGSGNLGIISSYKNELLNFSSGKLVLSEDKVKDRKFFYNSLVGHTQYPEFAEEICPQHLKYLQELAKKDKFITSGEQKQIFGKYIAEPISQCPTYRLQEKEE